MTESTIADARQARILYGRPDRDVTVATAVRSIEAYLEQRRRDWDPEAAAEFPEWARKLYADRLRRIADDLVAV